MTAHLQATRNALAQSMFIPSPPLTERNLPLQTSKTFIVTGANTGIGKDLASILYSKDGNVYAAGRNTQALSTAIEDIKKAHPNSKGKVSALKLDLADLPSIKGSAEDFLGKESELHVLWNNAGVMMPPHGSKTAQGYELQMGTNCLGAYLFTSHLRPILEKTAASAPANSVRVAWAGSLAIDFGSPPGGVRFDEKGKVKIESNPPTNYGASKAGNLFLAQKFGDEVAGKGIVSVCFNPGNLRTDLQRHVAGGAISKIIAFPVNHTLLYPSIYGSYTELYCGLSPDLTTVDNGTYIAPWGRKSHNRSDVLQSLKSESDGGSGTSEKFMNYVREETKAYL